MATILQSIQAAIENSGQTCYRICKGAGVAPSQLSRFVNGERGLSVEAVERLADYLGLEIVIRSKRRKRKPR